MSSIRIGVQALDDRYDWRMTRTKRLPARNGCRCGSCGMGGGGPREGTDVARET